MNEIELCVHGNSMDARCFQCQPDRNAAPQATSSADQSLKDFINDEYVQQVGAWKIIQRLEAERDAYKRTLEKIRDAGPQFSTHYMQGLATKALAQYDRSQK